MSPVSSQGLRERGLGGSLYPGQGSGDPEDPIIYPRNVFCKTSQQVNDTLSSLFRPFVVISLRIPRKKSL